MKLAFIGQNHLEGVEADALFAKLHGFTGLEFNYWANFEELSPETVGRTREILDQHGVECSALGLWGWNHLSPDTAEREKSHQMLHCAIDYAQTLGAAVLITGGGNIPDASIEENAAEFIKVFPPFLDRMGEAGLTPAFYAVHGGSFFTCIEAY